MVTISRVTGLPNRFTINGEKFCTEKIEDVRKMPLVFCSFTFDEDEWYFNNYFRFCASFFTTSNAELADALREKADELESDPSHGAFMIEKAEYILLDKRTMKSVNLLPNLNSEVVRPIDPRSYVVHFVNGVVVGLNPRQTKYDFDLREFTYVATRLNIDGCYVDLLNPDDVKNLSIPLSSTPTSSPTISLKYLLRFQAANIRKSGLHELSIEILRKSNEIYERDIARSIASCRKDDLMRLPRWLIEDCRVKEAREAEEHINALFAAFNPKQADQRAALATGDFLGYDAVEISALRITAPAYELIQGRVFSRKEFEKMQKGKSFRDVEGRKYKGFPYDFFGEGCPHIAMPFSTEYSKPRYSKEQLREWAAENARGCIINGKHYTLYEAQQLMHQKEKRLK